MSKKDKVGLILIGLFCVGAFIAVIVGLKQTGNKIKYERGEFYEETSETENYVKELIDSPMEELEAEQESLEIPLELTQEARLKLKEVTSIDYYGLMAFNGLLFDYLSSRGVNDAKYYEVNLADDKKIEENDIFISFYVKVNYMYEVKCIYYKGQEQYDFKSSLDSNE